MCVGLLFVQVFSPFGELWLTGSHGEWWHNVWDEPFLIRSAAWHWSQRPQQSELEAAALLKVVWWDLRLASLLVHLFQRLGIVLSTVGN